MFKIKRFVIILILLYGISIIYADTINANKIDHKKDNHNLNETQKSDTTKVYILNEEKSKNVNTEIINLLLPVFTLILGFLLNVFFNLFSERKKIMKEGVRWINELFYLKEPLKNQKQSIKDFLDQFRNEGLIIPNLYINENLNCEIFKSLDKSNFLKYLEKNNKNYQDVIKFSNEVHAFLSTLNYILNEIKSSFLDFRKSTTRSLELYNNNIQILILCLKDYGKFIEMKTGKKPIENAEFKSIFELFDNVVFSAKNNNPNDFSFFVKNFLNPLTEKILQNKENYNFKEFDIAILNCNNAILNIQTDKNNFEITLHNIIGLIEHSEKFLDHILPLNQNKTDKTS